MSVAPSHYECKQIILRQLIILSIMFEGHDNITYSENPFSWMHFGKSSCLIHIDPRFLYRSFNDIIEPFNCWKCFQTFSIVNWQIISCNRICAVKAETSNLHGMEYVVMSRFAWLLILDVRGSPQGASDDHRVMLCMHVTYAYTGSYHILCAQGQKVDFGNRV